MWCNRMAQATRYTDVRVGAEREVGRTERSERLEGGRLEELYRRHGLEAGRLAYLLTGDRALAEDLVQEAFVRLSGRLVQYRDPAGFGGYLFRTVVNLANSHHRRRQVEQRYLARVVEPTAVADGPPDVGVRFAMRDALLRLPVRQRAAVVLRYYLDMTDVQVAETMRCPVGTAKSLIHRGVEALRQEVQP
jgi:RNA polymerase sigma-70 factor (sigma-E family)